MSNDWKERLASDLRMMLLRCCSSSSSRSVSLSFRRLIRSNLGRTDSFSCVCRYWRRLWSLMTRTTSSVTTMMPPMTTMAIIHAFELPVGIPERAPSGAGVAGTGSGSLDCGIGDMLS